MPSSDDALLRRLLDELRDDTERSRAVWSQLRETLKAEPERIAASLCTWIDECLASGMTTPFAVPIIVQVMECTKNQPDLVPEEVLRSLLSRAEQLSDFSLLSLALMVARQRPDRILTSGIVGVLAATERALIEPPNELAREFQPFAKKLALELWRTVAAGDPASLVALLEKAGWQWRSSHLFAEMLLKAAPRDPSVLGDTIVVLEAIRAKEQQSAGELEPPDRILNKFKELNETVRRKEIAKKIVKEFLTGLPPPAAAPSPPRLTDEPVAASDVKVDRWIEDYLKRPDWEERMGEAERRFARGELREEDITLAESEPGQRLFAAMTEPGPALVAGVCELVDELTEADPMDERIETLVLALCLGLYRHSDLIPVRKFQQWAAEDAVFGDYIRAQLYGLLADVCPEWIIEYKLEDAVSVSVAAKSSDFFSKIGVCYPELLRQFVERYLSEAGRDSETSSMLMLAIQNVARERPEEIEALIALVEALRGERPRPGIIDFRYVGLTETLDSLRALGDKTKP